MKYAEADYIRAGYRYERGQIPAESLRHMIEQEHPDDKTEARRLIDRGRTEARMSRK